MKNGSFEAKYNFQMMKTAKKSILTLVQASGCSFNVVNTSWAIFCCSPELEYKVWTTWSRRPMSIFWLKSKSLLTVSWAKAVMVDVFSSDQNHSKVSKSFQKIIAFFVLSWRVEQNCVVRNRCKPDYASFTPEGNARPNFGARKFQNSPFKVGKF